MEVHIMKRKISFLLALLTVFSTAAISCGDDSSDKGGKDTTAPEDTTAALSTADFVGFPSESNGNLTFNVLINSHKAYEYDWEESAGDVVSDAVYSKNTAVEDYLGIKFNFNQMDGNWNDRDTFNGAIRNDVMSESREIDLVSSSTVITMPLAAEGLFVEGNDLTYCDFDHPWWIANMYNRFSCAGKLYGFIGDGSLSLYKDMTVIFFNKRIWENYKAPDPYELVRNNEWTLDKFIELCSGMSDDLNGDGKLDDTDQLTFLGEYVPCGTFQTSLQLDVVKIGSDGMPEYLGLTEKFISAFEKLQSFHAQEGVLRNNTIDDATYRTMATFADGNVATMCNFLYSTEYLRNMKDDYGIVPMPKYDENQENYVSQLGTSTTMFFVPVTTQDVELTSKVMETLAYYTNQMVVPKYYEVALKEKYARDTDIAEMLDIIRSGAAFDFLFVYGTALEGTPNSYFRFYDTNTSDLASRFAENETKFKTSLEKMIENYTNLEN